MIDRAQLIERAAIMEVLFTTIDGVLRGSKMADPLLMRIRLNID